MTESSMESSTTYSDSTTSSSMLMMGLPRGPNQPPLTSKTMAFPESEMRKILDDLARSNSDEAWREQYDALTKVKAMVGQYGMGMAPHLRELIPSLLQKTACLRSVVAKHAMQVLRDVITGLRTTLDPYVDSVVTTLVSRAATSKFLAEAATEVLYVCGTSFSETRFINAMMNAYSATKCDKSHVLVMQVLAQKTTMTIWKVVDPVRWCNFVVRGLSESHPDVRSYARQVVVACGNGPQVERILMSHLTATQIDKWMKVLIAKDSSPQQLPPETLSTPTRTPSTQQLSVTPNTGGKSSGAVMMTTPTNNQGPDSLAVVESAMYATEWKDRLSSTEQLRSCWRENTLPPRTIADTLLSKCYDANAKVQQLSVRLMEEACCDPNVVEHWQPNAVVAAAAHVGQSSKAFVSTYLRVVGEEAWLPAVAHFLSTQQKNIPVRVMIMEVAVEGCSGSALRKWLFSVAHRLQNDPKGEIRSAAKSVMEKC